MNHCMCLKKHEVIFLYYMREIGAALKVTCPTNYGLKTQVYTHSGFNNSQVYWKLCMSQNHVM